MCKRPGTQCVAMMLALVVASAPLRAQPDAASTAETSDAPRPLRTDSPAPYVHRITLYDHDGVAIAPDDEPAQPYSPMRTCGKCHEVGLIAKGWHFNAGMPDVDDGRPGEPWLLTDRESGLTLPISARDWPGAVRPDDVGLSAWELTRRFGRHAPGGGFAAPSQTQIDASPQATRWEISGPREIDCLMCHAGAAGYYDPAEAARQLEAENLRWAATAAAGLAVIRGEARKVPDDFDPYAPPNPDFPEQTLPVVEYDASRFDADDRVVLDITRRPPAERCLFCHGFREVGRRAPPKWLAPVDVHLAAGMTCTDCHRNGIDHNITRGYESGRADDVADQLTCRGCHLGATSAAGSPGAGAGERGAPVPVHRGLPPVHFERLSCTACHSGPSPETHTRRFQTAMSHGLGLPTRERRDDDPPEIVAPVFVRRDDGKIAPHRMVWPTLGTPDAAPPPDIDLSSVRIDESRPYLWPLAHNVRPAAQALGARACTECHAADAPIYFGRLDAGEPADDDARKIQTMIELRGDDEALPRALAMSFRWRTAFKWTSLACMAVVLVVWLRHAFAGAGASRAHAALRPDKRRQASRDAEQNARRP